MLQRAHFPQLFEVLQTQPPKGTGQVVWTNEENGEQAIRSGGDSGKLRTKALPKVAATAELQAPISRGEHWPGMARSS